MGKTDTKSNLLRVLTDKGFKLETVSSGYTKVFLPNEAKHDAILEVNGTISLSNEIADRFDDKQGRSGKVGRFKYTWTGAEALSADEIVQKLLGSNELGKKSDEIEQKLPESKKLEKKKPEKKKHAGMQWYALHVYSGQENKVSSYLMNEAKRTNLDERVAQVLVPQENIIEMKDGKKVVKTKNFFPGYILMEMVLDKETQHMVLDTPGVINFLGTHHAPQVIQPAEIERILGRTREKEEVEMMSVPFSIGDTVKVIDGPFNDFSGFIEEINQEKNKVKVMVSIFGRPTPVELDFLQVEQEK